MTLTHSHLPARRDVLRTLLAAGASAVALPGWAADTYPSRPIAWVVPYPTGGFGDALSRSLAQKLSESLKVPVIVDNRPGAGGQIGVSYAKQQPADGYTLLYGDIGPFSMNAALYAKLPYDMQKDFSPVTRLLTSPSLLVVGASSPIKNFDDLVKAAKTERGVSYGSYGVGSAPHVFGAMLQREAGGRYEHVAYKGAAPALQDLIGGHIDVMCDVIASSAPMVRDGKLRALAVVGVDQRVALLPQVPTLAELGHGSLNLLGWTGVVVRAGTPRPIVDRLHLELVQALKSPDIVARYTELGLGISPQTPEQFGQFMQGEAHRWGQVIQAANIRVD
ncbi:tripartite tricarboxylate transporter substrate binding protein [Variovorax sp. J22P168]|uniref:Bug family tripartite tricarboxylate transporter substrate binding protein n=1 Tax=Variovorax jilinensis TaxID=3053513 RepID=UPI002578E045|nr:tripartite tricarboxylate transporter substrate binding protein [Variovorax sp. J22P168]MDM0012096.1 tripartite tricarboxylate transporter substrate binding protein [Variovorax sp. J22P168]